MKETFMAELAYLLHEKHILESRLEGMVYGSIEIRDTGSKKCIYVHRREGGLQVTKYVGEYSNELNSTIIENNVLAKDLKKRLRLVNKELLALNYLNQDLNDRVKLNIDLARRHMVDSIYKQAMLEGVATTYSDTETIVNGGKVKDMNATDITKVINLKHSWDFILDENVISYPTSFPVLTQINGLVEEGLSYSAGKVRSLPVSIGGSTYIPPIPLEYQIKEDLLEILNKEISLETAIELILFVMKKQIFTDGNKRTAVIFANHYMISHGLGIIVIPAELVDEYKKLLVLYYEDRDLVSIKDFLKDKCVISF